MKHSIEVLIPEKEIQERISILAEQITQHYKGSNDLVIIGLLRGSFIFVADLARAIQCPLTLDFMTVSSYGANMHSGDVTVLKDLDDDIEGRDVLLVEDIIDTGKTLHSVCEILARRNPKSIRICTLLDKPERREIEIAVDWVGFQIPDEFVVGLGIDYAQKYRNLPYIGKVVPA
ncbi:MAG: hypoxanthine phosphoribosyltransferase [Enterovibrio sp.]